jgi:hypothetical protein
MFYFDTIFNSNVSRRALPGAVIGIIVYT